AAAARRVADPPAADPGPEPAPEDAGRPAAVLDREAERARRDFHRAAAAGAGSGATPRPPKTRSAALQAFFVANAGRGLLPAGESSGGLSPRLKTEEP
ncbi:MAG: twin-arginine translocation signal domain-containing protein, partial [Brevundimonas sp.]